MIKKSVKEAGSNENSKSVDRGAIGGRGASFDYEMCDEKQVTALKEAYQIRFKEFCRGGGYEAGLTGTKPEVACPTEDSQEFQAQFQSGSLERISGQITELHSEISRLNKRIKYLENENWDLQRQNSSLESKVQSLKQ